MAGLRQPISEELDGDIRIEVYCDEIVIATHVPTGTRTVATAPTLEENKTAAVELLQRLVSEQTWRD